MSGCRPGNRFFFDTAAFAQVTAPGGGGLGSYGNVGRNAFRQPNYYDVDSSLTRTFPVHDRLPLNLRLEAFNLLNHPNFKGFTTALNSSTFGYATSANAPRIFQAAAKVTF